MYTCFSFILFPAAEMPSKHLEMMGITFFSTSENWQYPFARCRILCSSISCIF